MKHSLLALAGFVAAAAIAAPCQGVTPPTGAAPTPVLQQHNPRYQLHKSDSFEVDFTFSPEFNQVVTVEPDGYITLKEVGSIHAEGETVPELTEILKNAYGKMLHDPAIVIVLRDFDKPYFIASGEVTKPGKYDLRGPLTVTEAVAIAGGFTGSAKHSQVVLFHPVSDTMFEAKLLDVKKLLAQHNLNEDLRLQPGDFIYVPESKIAKIRKFLPAGLVGAYYNANASTF